MKGVNLLPPTYKKQLRMRHYEQLGIGIVVMVCIGSLVLMLWPLRLLEQKKNELRGVTYRLQDTRFEQVTWLQEEKARLEDELTHKKQEIMRLGKEAVPTGVWLYNLFERTNGDLSIERITMGQKNEMIVVEGLGKTEEAILEYIGEVETLYKQGELYFEIEELGVDRGIAFSLSLMPWGEGVL